jgi:hypothetical protein
MPKAIRQENLYGAEDWSMVYSSFKNAEFTSYDFDTLRDSMVNYMQVNYPEEFNDYIQSSEFIALLDLVAYVGQNLAFRMDLNARENILDTAEKRESVLRIARMLSYKPKRVRPAQGFLKVTSVITTDQIIDSTGANLANKTVQWGSDTSELEYERFVRILNAALSDNNKFGTPVKRSVNSDNSNIFEIYQFNNTNLITNYPINAVVDGIDLNFDLLPIDIDKEGYITQTEPDYENAFSLMYRNDGKGVGSTKTGFFFLSKQGFISSTIEYMSTPVANAVIDLPQTGNISEEDYFVQTVDEYGTVLKTWTKVSNLDFSNIVVNDQNGVSKDLYEVIYSDNDITSIKFGDGTFTNVPTGYIRIWYRSAENNFIKVRAGEINNVTFDITYTNASNQTQTLSMVLELQDNMVTGLPAETLDEIKQNAPEAFYSKNRMVTGDDYNGFLPTLNNDVLIMKAENRTFSGHSRNVDLADPTGKSRPLVEFADDGYLYSDEYNKNFYIADDNNRRSVDLLDEYIENKLSDIGLLNFYYGKLNLGTTADPTKFSLVDLGKTTWYTTLQSSIDSTAVRIKANGINTNNPYDQFSTTGGMIQIDNELCTYTGVEINSGDNEYFFIGVSRAQQGTTAVAHTASATIYNVYDYRWQSAYSDATGTNGYISESNNDITPQKLGFTTSGPLRNIRPGSFVKFEDNTGTATWATILDIKGDGLGLEDGQDDSLYTGLLANGMGPVEINKVITDEQLIKSIIPSFTRVFDETTRNVLIEKLEDKKSFALKFDNQTPRWVVIPSSVTIDVDSDFNSSNDSTAWVIYVKRETTGWTVTIRQLDYIFGSEELIRFYNINFAPTFNPSFQSISNDTISIIGLNEDNKLEDKQTYRISGYYVYDDGYTDNSKVKVTPIDLDNDFLPDDPRHFLNIVGTNTIKLANYNEGDFTYLVPDATATGDAIIDTVPGVTNQPFKWNHKVSADQTLNPSLTNIVDVYVLTKSYNEDYTVWKRKNNSKVSPPLPPTTEELRGNFAGLLSYKMMTDEIIFHPVKFKPLFGTLAESEFQAQFKVVKSPKSKLTDSEVKSKVIAAVDKFFTPGNFGFGEIFYFTELAAYIHTSLSTDLNSVVIVPISTASKFGTLFQIQPDRNEVVTSVASVNDIIVINEITDSNIRIGK